VHAVFLLRVGVIWLVKDVPHFRARSGWREAFQKFRNVPYSLGLYLFWELVA
jgi:hypothetical protein